MISTTKNAQPQTTTASTMPQVRSHSTGWLRGLQQRGVTLLHTIESYAAVTLGSTGTALLSIAHATRIFESVRTQQNTPQKIKLQTHAFARLHRFLSKQSIARQTGVFQPLLLLIASRVAHIPDELQREQALTLLASALQRSPQLGLAEALTTQLWGLPRMQAQRTFDILEQFLQHSDTGVESHVDIYLELIDVMQIPSCRQRAHALVIAGLAQLDRAATMRTRIAGRLPLTNPSRIEARALWFDM